MEKEQGQVPPTPLERLSFLSILLLLVGFFFLGFLAILPLTWKDQLILGILLLIGSAIVNRSSETRRNTTAMLLIASFCTARYGYYRYSETIWNIRAGAGNIPWLDIVFVISLLSAETYAFIVLWLGVFQTIRPLRRRPLPMPEHPAGWPTIDVFIPTYNEPLDVVRTTVLAALNMDWPEDRYQVYILDDGRRHEFQEFADTCGAHYFTRLDNAHAKAGNINNALKQTNGDYIAIFDCDHIPTRSFLQMTLGWFIADDNLAMLQTPHHYYSADPFERNLKIFRDVPNEGALFYGVIQDGNDLWNATFFCGSCAVIRRTALDEIGGIAVETVTEDAHTALRLHSRGWDTAYINIPLAAGLATARLSDHIGQRIRWARGMIQILRVDNPLFTRGLRMSQRLCYLNAMLHFLFAGPRLIFLTSPLVFLILGHSNVFGYLPTILAYAFPHLLISTLANARIQKKHRHSFWNEVYEIALSPYILLPTMLALVNPKWGKFNVTAKRSVVEGSYFDFRIARPFLVLFLLNLIGIVMGARKWMLYSDPEWIIRVNIFWAVFNLVLLGATLAVAYERTQKRGTVRVNATLPMRMLLSSGEAISGRTIDLSMGGMLVRLMRSAPVQSGQALYVSVALSDGEFTFPVNVVEAWGAEVRLVFSALNLPQEAALTRAIFSRADTWIDWGKNYRPDHPLKSLITICGLAFRGVGCCIREPFRRAKEAEQRRAKQPRAKSASGAAMLLLLVLAGAMRLDAQRGAAPRTAPAAAAQTAAASFRDERDLASIGYKQGVPLHGNGARVNVQFGVPKTKLVTAATLGLAVRAPGGLASGSALRIWLNGSEVSSISLAGSVDGAAIIPAPLALPSEFVMNENTLGFELMAGCAQNCDDADNGVWAVIEPTTQLRTSGTLLPVANDLSILPEPFFEIAAQRLIDLPFVFDAADSSSLQAAGIVASWFGMKADYRGIRFPVRYGAISAGNVVFIGTTASPVAVSLGLASSAGSISMRDNPQDPYGKLLAIVAPDSRQLLAIARAFATGAYTRSGEQSVVDRVDLPRARQEYDAPRWLLTDRGVRLTAGMSESELQVAGTGRVNVYFRLPPDLYYGSREVVPLRLQYRCAQLLPGSDARLKVFLNGVFVAERPIPTDSLTDVHEELFSLPAQALYAGNTLAVDFSFERVRVAAGASRYPRASLLGGTEIVIRGMSHFTAMPRLELFASTGFPFTRYADLSETTVLLPPSPAPEETSLFLSAMSSIGAQTGYPALRVTVLTSSDASVLADRDVLMIGGFDDQPLFRKWAGAMLIRPEANQLRLAPNFGVSGVWEAIPWTWAGQQRRALETLLQNETPDGVVQEFESPVTDGRSVVAITPAIGRTLAALADDWAASANAFHIQGTATVFYNGQFRSFFVKPTQYHVGRLPVWDALQYWCRRYYWFAPILVFAWIFILTRIINPRLEARARRRLWVQAQ